MAHTNIHGIHSGSLSLLWVQIVITIKIARRTQRASRRFCASRPADDFPELGGVESIISPVAGRDDVRLPCEHELRTADKSLESAAVERTEPSRAVPSRGGLEVVAAE